MKVHNKVIAVTGAGGGIGGALVLELLDRGARVAALDLSDEGLKKLKNDAGPLAKQLSTHSINITDRVTVEKLPGHIKKAHGSIDGLINCAGIVQPFVKINELEYDAIERVMNVNFNGTLYMTKAFLPVLLKRPEAHLVNVSSMGGFLPVPGQAIYGASKAAVKLMTEGLYAELHNTNVHVSVVFPGATATNITANSGVDAPGGSDVDASSYKMLTAEEAAEIIVTGMEKDKLYIYTGKDSKFMNKLYRLAPQRATNFITKKMASLLR